MAWWKFWEKRSLTQTSYSDTGGAEIINFFSSPLSSSGVTVNETTALELTPIGAAVRILSEDIASLPLILYETKRDGRRERAINHNLYGILKDNPNPYMTSMAFREVMMSHVLTWGNAYAEIQWDASGQVVALWPLRPDTTSAEWDETERKLVYRTIIKGASYVLPAYRVLHIHGLGSDGLRGYSPIRLHRESLGLAKAAEKYGATYFGNGAKPGGVLEHPGQLSDTATKHLRESWNQMHSGLENSHRIAILEEGMTYKQIGLPPEDSQFLETRKFQVEEIARIYRIPLHMLNSLDRATFNNIEHQSIQYVSHTLNPWFVRWEQAIQSRLLTPSERKKYYAKHNVNAFLRGDFNSRGQFYQTALQNGWMNRNEVRELEDMNRIEGDIGEVYTINTASQPIDLMLKGGGSDGQGNPIPANEGGA